MSTVLRDLRTPTGGPSVRARGLAALVVAGLVVLTAPVVVLPAIRLLGGLVR